MTRSVVCGECKAELPSESVSPGAEDAPCPQCGSLAKHVTLELSDSVTVQAHDNIRGKARKGPGKKGITQDFFAGDDERVSKGDYVDKQRLIDRENDRYIEKVTDKVTGEVIHETDHPLSEHWGHGSAKIKKTTPNADKK